MPNPGDLPGLMAAYWLVREAADGSPHGIVSDIIRGIRSHGEAYRPGLSGALEILDEAVYEAAKEVPIMRYKLGPVLAQRTYPGVPNPPAPAPTPGPNPPPVLPDVDATLGQIGDTDVEVIVAGYAPGAAVPPVEVRLYLAPVGSTLPADAAGWVASAFPVTTFPVPTPTPGPSGNVGQNLYRVAVPAVAKGDYLGQIVLGYAS